MPSVVSKSSFSISRKLLFVCFYFLLLFVFRNLNSAISLSVENTRNSFFSSEQDTLCHYWIKKNDFKPWVTYRTNIIFLRVITSNLTGLPCSVVRYGGDNEKGSSIFTRNHELFCLLDKHYSPLLAKKVDYTKKWEFDIPSSPWQSGAKGEWRVSSCWRYKSLQFIWQMFFLSTFLEKSVTIFSNFHFPLLPWQLRKVTKNKNCELIPSSRQFCT